jgi:hypothetical protein
MYRVEHPRSGDLVFDEEGIIRRDGSDERIIKTTKHGFLGIDNVHEVEDLLRNTLLETVE